MVGCCLVVCRYALVKEKRALTKFLKCVDWTDAQEARQVWEGTHHSTSHHSCCCLGHTPISMCG